MVVLVSYLNIVMYLSIVDQCMRVQIYWNSFGCLSMTNVISIDYSFESLVNLDRWQI